MTASARNSRPPATFRKASQCRFVASIIALLPAAFSLHFSRTVTLREAASGVSHFKERFVHDA